MKGEEFMEDEWMPSLDEYNPNITKEQWIVLVKDKEIFNEKSLIVFACIQKAKIATCADMAEEFGRSNNFYNTNNWQTGKRIYEKLKCPLSQRENGSERFWSICVQQKITHIEKNNRDRWLMKIRPELQEAFDETGVLEGIEIMGKKMDRFTWIPFYTELAEKLLEYKDNRDELVKIIFGMERQYVNYIKDDNGNDYTDIDPFSVFAIFNRSSTEERRKEICKYFKSVFQLQSDIPKDFDSIPLMNPQLSVFVWRGDIFTGIQPIWDLYSTISEENFNSDKFVNQFDVVRSQKGIKWNLTMALFWICPYDFMPLDTPSREYLNKIGIEVFDEKNLNGENYLNLLLKIKSKMENNEIKEKSFLEISYNAWLKDTTSQGESQMQNPQEKLINETKTLLENTKNLILTGAPGTGKTFLAKQIAKEMGCSENEIGFVQFHPSYDYTDFVEGLRPVQNDVSNQIGFERKDGVFKEFCAKALKNYMIIDEVIEDYFKQNKLFEVEGDKSTFNVSIEDDNLAIKANNYRNPSYGTKKELVEYNKSLKDDENAKLEDKKKIQELVYKKILTDIKQKPFVFIIDEINRGEVSKIFGELFYCIDPGYRGEKGKISTQYQNLVTSGEFQKGFFIPENVYIIGTMNDIDRSVESMDFAFRRRFAWKEITANDTQYMLDEVEKDGETFGLPDEIAEEAKKRMNRLNNKISELPDFNSAYHIGASYFLKLNQYEGTDEERFTKLWEYHLEGLLKEYLRGSGNEKAGMELLRKAYFGEKMKENVYP